MLVNPYGTPPGTTAQWADWVAARFFGSEPGGSNVVIFGVACTVGSIVGYMVQQFIVGTGIAKVLGKLKDAGKFASLTGKLSDGLTVVKDTVGKVATVAKGAAQKFTRGVGEAVNRFLKRIGLKLGDDAAQSVATCVARMGAANSCVLDRLVDVKLANGRRLGKDFLDGLHTRLGKMSPDAQAHVHRWAEELAQTASPKRASELEGYLRYVEKYGNDISEIRPHLNLGPDFRRITGGLEDVKHYPNVPDFLFPQLARRDAVQHLRHLQEFGPTKIVYPYRMPDTFTQLLEGFGVSPGDIVNGL